MDLETENWQVLDTYQAGDSSPHNTEGDDPQSDYEKYAQLYYDPESDDAQSNHPGDDYVHSHYPEGDDVQSYYSGVDDALAYHGGDEQSLHQQCQPEEAAGWSAARSSRANASRAAPSPQGYPAPLDQAGHTDARTYLKMREYERQITELRNLADKYKKLAEINIEKEQQRLQELRKGTSNRASIMPSTNSRATPTTTYPSRVFYSTQHSSRANQTPGPATGTRRRSGGDGLMTGLRLDSLSPIAGRSVGSNDLLTDTLMSLKNSLDRQTESFNRQYESLNRSNRARVQTDSLYRLTDKMDFRLWREKLNIELGLLGLADVLGTNPNSSGQYTEEEQEDRDSQVKAILVSRLDNKHHKMVLSMYNPREMLNHLQEQKRLQENLDSDAVRDKLRSLVMRKNEGMADYLVRFEDLVGDYHARGDSTELQESELTNILLNNVSPVMPAIRHYFQGHRVYLQRVMPLSTLKNTLLDLEANSKANKERQQVTKQHNQQKQQYDSRRPTGDHRPGGQRQHGVSARLANPMTREVDWSAVYDPKFKQRCNRCRRSGHDPRRCPLIRLGLWFCGACCKMAPHIAKDCDDPGPEYLAKMQASSGSGGNGKAPNRKDNNKFNRRNKKPYSTDKQVNDNHDTCKFINFIADSGASEHIIGKGFILNNFKKTQTGIIKSANRDKKADMKIDGKGNLLVYDKTGKIFELTNVLVAGNVAGNLLSLRKFVDIGLSIFLDNKQIRIYDATTGEIYITGQYVKPVWRINFENIQTENQDIFQSIECTAKMISVEDFISQSQTDVNELSTSEGVNDNSGSSKHPSDIGRENKNKVFPDHNQTEFFTDADLDENKLNRKIHEYNKQLLTTEEKASEVTGHKDRRLGTVSPGLKWHRRLGHLSLGYLRKLKQSVDELKDVKFGDDILDCGICKLSKMENKPHTEVRERSEKALGLVHSDMMGPIKPESFPGRNRYIITFTDDYSRYSKIYSIKQKSQAGDCLEDFLRKARNLLGENAKVCYIRADCAKEYLGGKFFKIMEKEGIDANFSPPHTHQLNGTSERLNKTLEFKIRSMIIDSGIPPSMWVLAAEAAIHVHNRSPHKANNFEIPLRKFAPRTKLHLNRLRRFGCKTYVLVPQPKTKFSAVSLETIFVGYTKTGYLLWHPSSGKFINSCNVDFNEKVVYRDDYTTKPEAFNLEKFQADSTQLDKDQIVDFLVENDNQSQTTQHEPLVENQEKAPTKRGRKRKTQTVNQTDNQTEEVPAKRFQPARKANRKTDYRKLATGKSAALVEDTSFANFVTVNLDKSKITFEADGEEPEKVHPEEDELKFTFMAQINKDPASYKQAMSTPDAAQWQSAVKQEIDSMVRNKVWDLVNKQGIKQSDIIDSRWVFKTKIDENGRLTRKGRLVIRGFKDPKQYDLLELYAPVSRLPLIRTFLSIVNKHNLELCQMDVTTAFLNGELEEYKYMEIPDGLNVPDEVRRTKVCRLKKAIYGLKISPKRWNKKFTEVVESLGLSSTINEPCLYTRRHQGEVDAILLYVDDMLIASNSTERLNTIKRQLKETFEMKDLGEPNQFLGMKITRNRTKQIITIKQTEYTEKVLERFGMQKCYPKRTPMESRQVQNRNTRNKVKTKRQNKQKTLNSDKEQSNVKRKVPYREAIGSLLYLAGGTRPDIAYAVNVLARRQSSPTSKDWEDVLRVFQYLRGTAHYGLTYTGKLNTLEAKTDSSYDDWTDSTSTGGFLIELFGDVVTWKSYKQEPVCLSTTKAEYLTMSEACRQVISLEKAARDVTGQNYHPFTVRCDNRAAVKNTQKEGCHKLCDFDDPVPEVVANLRFREENGVRPELSNRHGD